MNRPIIIGIFLFLVSVGVLLFLLNRPERKNAEPAAPAQPAATENQHAATETAPSQRRINVLLFFNEKNSTRLTTEDRFVSYKELLRDQAFEVLKELAQGSATGLASTLPEGTQLRDLFITRDGVAYVDFSPELSQKHVGGSLAEINTVYAIVNTLTLNFPQIKSVQILVDDHAVETLTGHLDLSRPLRQDLSMVKSSEVSRETPVQTSPTNPG